MGKPAARIGDMHVCPMFDGPKPHVGGPIIGPGVPNVLIGGMPAAVMGDMCVCVGPPDMIAMGSTGVLIGGKPAARMGDQCAHGGKIVIGMPTVLIGETGSGSVVKTQFNTLTPQVDTPKPPTVKKADDMNKEAKPSQSAAGGGGGGAQQSNAAKEAAAKGSLGMNKC